MWRSSGLALLGFCLLSHGTLPAQTHPRAAAQKTGTFAMSGTVVDGLSGQPLSGALVVISTAQDESDGQSRTTGEDGRFTFERLKPGKYLLAAQHPGYARQNFNQHEEFSTAIVVGPNLRSSDLEFRLFPDASISGTVTDDAGETVRDAQVLLLQDGVAEGRHTIRQQGQAATDDRGHYLLSHLSPGRFFVVVETQPWYARSKSTLEAGDNAGTAALQSTRSELDVAYPVTYYPGVADAATATVLELKPGDRASADVTLTAVPAVHLIIRNTDSLQGGAIAMLRLFDGPRISVGTLVGRSGSDIEIAGAPQGQVELRVTSAERRGTGSSRTVSMAADGEINAGQKMSSPEISGVVSVDGAAPPSDSVIQLVDPTANAAMNARVGDKGEFHLESTESSPGDYEVRISNFPGMVRTVSAEGAKTSGRTVHIAGGGPVRLKIEATRNLGRVEGVVLRNGKPMPGAMVILVPRDVSDAALFRRDQSDSDGTFTLPRVLPGSYSVIALSDWDTEWLNPAVLKPYLKQVQPIEITSAHPAHVEVKVQ